MAGAVEDMLHSAYSVIRGIEQNRSMAPVTLDHLLKDQIEAIKGGESAFILLASTGTRSQKVLKISRLAMLDNIEKAVDQVVKAVSSAGSDKAKLRDLGLDTVGQGTT